MRVHETTLRKTINWVLQDAAPKKPGIKLPFSLRFIKALDLTKHSIALYHQTARETDVLPEYPFQATDFEKQVPFVKNSVWLYLSYIPFFVALVFFQKERSPFEQTLKTMWTLTTINNSFFRKYPAHFTHNRVPASSLTWWKPTDRLWRFLYDFDSSWNNLFPSQHVSLSVLCGLSLYHSGYRRSGRLLLLWAVLLGASTLTTKQHYQVDVVAALVLASKVHRENCLKESNQEVAAEMIENHCDTLFKNLATGNYRPRPEEKIDLLLQIDPLIIEIMKNIRKLNPFNPLYSEIISNTLALIKRV